VATYYVRKERNPDGSEGPPDADGLFYWFDGSDAAATDPDAVWTDETNADDSDVTTFAYTSTAGSSVSNYLQIEGTDAPASGDTISSVDVWVYFPAGNETVQCFVSVYEDGGTALESNMSFTGEQSSDGAWFSSNNNDIAAPVGGWTWAKVQGLEVRVFTTTAELLQVAAIGVAVHTTTEGESATNPLRTIDSAANTVAAGDTVYVGAGTYRELVTMDTSGSSGSPISFIADVDGSQTGDAGLVVVSALDESAGITTPRSYCWVFTGREFITTQGFVFQGGSIACAYASASGSIAFEGIEFLDCVFLNTLNSSDDGLYVAYGATASTPTTTGLKVDGCYFHTADKGIVVPSIADQTDSDLDMKVVVTNCVFNVGSYGYQNSSVAAQTTYDVGGVTITNCTFLGADGIWNDADLSVTYPTTITNCIFNACGTAINQSLSEGHTVSGGSNVIVGTVSNVTLHPTDVQGTAAPPLLGGMADLPLYRFWGWSPYRPFEPMENGDDWTYLVTRADTTAAPATDLYGESKPMNRSPGTRRYAVFYFDASDSGPTDPGVSWTNEANIFDDPGEINLVDNSNNYGSTTTQGSASADYITAVGTNAPTTAPAGSSDSDIAAVDVVVAGGYDGVNPPEISYQVRHSSETLGSAGPSQLNDDPRWVHPSGSATSWVFSTVSDLTPPTGGWTWAKIAALELRIWKNDAAATDELRVYAGFIRVKYNNTIGDDIGAVESRARPQKEVSTIRTGTASFRFEGAGFHDVLIPVAATSTTVSVYGRYDSNHSGSLPQLQVLDIPGVADQTDTMVAAANTWEELTATFTPTASGIARVRMVCRDTSSTGKVFFDDLTVT
jgi:hypothetical protein